MPVPYIQIKLSVNYEYNFSVYIQAYKHCVTLSVQVEISNKKKREQINVTMEIKLNALKRLDKVESINKIAMDLGDERTIRVEKKSSEIGLGV